MATMSNFDTRRRHSPPNGKSEYFKDFFGTQLVELSPNQTLRRKPNTLNFAEELHNSKSTVSQPRTEERYKNNLFSENHSSSHRYNLGLNFHNGITSPKIYHPTANTFFSSDGVMSREKNSAYLQKPISRPNSQLFANNVNSIAMSQRLDEERLSSTATKKFTSIWNDYEETANQNSHLKRQNTVSLPQLTTQQEWPPLRHQSGLVRANRSLNNNQVAKDKAFVDSLFPGGIDAFVQHNLQKPPTSYIKPHFLALSPPPSPPPALVGGVSLPEAQYPRIMKVMSGKQLIEDLDKYEGKEQQRAKELSRSISTLSLHDHIDKNTSTHSLRDQVGRNTSTLSLREEVNRTTSTLSLREQLDKNTSTHSLCDQVGGNTSTVVFRDQVDRSTGTLVLREKADRNTNTLILRDQVDENPAHNHLSHSNFRSDSHDIDGRRNKGFRRGHEALKVAISEKWACMDRVLNAPLDPISRDSRFFVIKSNCELDIFASLKHGIWTSTDLGNKRLDRAYCDPTRKGPIFLFFSVSGSGMFCGLAEMTSAIDHSAHTGIWSDKRWRGRFTVKWLNVKDVPNGDLRQFRVANNDNKPFTNCRDTQEILINPGESVYNLFNRYVSSTSVFQSAYEEQNYSNDELHHV